MSVKITLKFTKSRGSQVVTIKFDKKLTMDDVGQLLTIERYLNDLPTSDTKVELELSEDELP